MTTPPSLRARCFGPNAVALSILVARGEIACARARSGYGKFLEFQLTEIQKLARVGDCGAHYDALLQTTRDLKTSAIMAGWDGVAGFALLLERTLATMEPYDTAQAQVVAVHLDAIRLAANPQTPPQHLAHIAEDLRSKLRIRFGG